MAFTDYSTTSSANTQLSDGTYIGPNMLRNKVRPALQQLAADGKALANDVETKINISKGDTGPMGSITLNDLPITVVPAVADGVTDDAPVINAALADADTSIVMLPEGTLGIKSPIVIPSGKTLRGAGVERTIVKVIATFSKGIYDAAAIYPELGSSNVGVEDLTVNAANLYNGGVATTPNRISGVLFEQVDGFRVRDVNVKNCTGYGHYAAGAGNGTNLVRNGYYENCHVENCNVNFEAQDGYNITYDNCHSTDGDGDNPSGQESHFHPYLGCNDIRYYGCTAIGTGHGWYLIASSYDQSDIILDGCKAVMSSGGSGLLVTGETTFFNERLILTGSHFESGTQAGALLDYIIEGEAVGCRFYSTTVDAQNAFGVVNYANSEMEFVGCRGRGTATIGAVGGFGIANLNSDSRWLGGKLEGLISGTASGVPGAMSDPIEYTGGTVLIPAVSASLNEGTAQAVTNVSGTTSTLKSGLGWYRVVKTGGTNGVQDGFAESAVNLDGDFVITVVPRITDDGAFAVGVSTSPGGGWAAMEAAFYHDGTGALGFGVPSSGLASAGIYIPYEPLHIVRESGVISFYRGGSTYLLGRLVGTATDATTVGFDLSAWNSSATLDVRVGKL